MFESKDEKEARKAAREAARVAEAAQRAEAQFRASPVGQALAAREQGHGFFQIELDGAALRFNWPRRHGPDLTFTRSDVLAQIEEIGWHLMHISHVWVQTGANSRDKFMTTGQEIAVTGRMVGVYLFRVAGSD